MNCPRCNSILTKGSISEKSFSIEIDKCPSCGGIWFDEGELIKLDKIIEPTFIEIKKVPNKKAQLKGLACPSCNSFPMEKAEHPRDKKVILDYCQHCRGIWLDQGELEAIQKESWIITISKIFKWLSGKD